MVVEEFRKVKFDGCGSMKKFIQLLGGHENVQVWLLEREVGGQNNEKIMGWELLHDILFCFAK